MVSKFTSTKKIRIHLGMLVTLLIGGLLLSGIMPTAAQSTPAATEAAGAYLISVSSSKDLGKYLVGKDGMTLYVFTVDPLNESMCQDGGCAKAWPSLIVKSADEATHDPSIPGTFGTTAHKDGSLQVTYNGMPLYYWFKDKAAGDTTGNRVTRNWWVVSPATVYAQELPKVGNVLVGPKGMTLYMFTKDTPDKIACTGDCLKNWPALTVKSADEIVPGLNLPGKWNTVKRDDGSLQVTYNGSPLYYFAKDKAIGDANGENVGKVWFTVAPETVVVSANKDQGNIVISADGMTLYTFAKDTANTSTCTGDCAKAWPAFWVYNSDKLVAGTGVTGKLGTIKHDDDTMQVTYNGMPLYLYSKDAAPGDAKGQGVGNVWNVVKP